MKKKDITAASALLAILADPQAMVKAIAELEQKHAEASDKIGELDGKAKDMDVREAALNALMEDHRRQEAYLTDWNQKLEGREKDHQASIEAAMAEIMKQRHADSQQLAERTEQQNLRENSLNEQARQILQERQAIDQFADKLREREEAVAAREEKWQHDHQELLNTKAKLRELMA